MLTKLERLLDLLIVIAERYSIEAKAQTSYEADDAARVKLQEKKVRKAKAAPAEEAPAPAATPAEDQLGLGAIAPVEPPPVPKELTEKESFARMEEVTKQFVTLCKNDKPEDGKTRAIKMMQTDARFKVGKLGDLTHAQRLLWIAEMEKGVAEHK